MYFGNVLNTKVIKISISMNSPYSDFFLLKLQTLVTVTMVEHVISVISHSFALDIG